MRAISRATFVVIQIVFAATVLVNAADAVAQPAVCRRAFNAGNFIEAGKCYAKSYQESGDAFLLFAQGEALREASRADKKHCNAAKRAYENFLSEVKGLDQATRDTIQNERIPEMKRCHKEYEDAQRRPECTVSEDCPNNKRCDDGSCVTRPIIPTPADKCVGDDDCQGGRACVSGRCERLRRARYLVTQFGVGLAAVSMGDALDTLGFGSPKLSLALTAGYPILEFGGRTLSIGAAFTLVPIKWASESDPDVKGTSLFVGTLANIGLNQPITPKFDVHFDAGLGLQHITGLELGNPFTLGAAAVSSALTLFQLRLGITPAYRLTKNISLAAPFALSYSPSDDNFRDDISSVFQYHLLFGVVFTQ